MIVHVHVLLLYSLVVEYPLRNRKVLGSGRVTPKTLKMLLTATLCDGHIYIKSFSKGNNTRAYVVGYQYWAVAKRHKKKEIGILIMFVDYVSTTVKLFVL